MKTLIICTMMFIAGFADALAGDVMATREQVGMFLNSKTYVVISPAYIELSSFLKKAVEAKWKMTEYEFIDPDKFDELRFSSKNSFLLITTTSIKKDKVGVNYYYLNLVLGDTAKDVSKMPEFCAIPLCYCSDKSFSCSYAFNSIISFVQKNIEELKSNYLPVSINGLEYYNRNTQMLKSKTLYFLTEGLNSSNNSKATVGTYYLAPFEISDLDNIEDIIDNTSTPIAFMYLIRPPEGSSEMGRWFVMIFDTEGNLCYYKSALFKNNASVGLTANDLKYLK